MTAPAPEPRAAPRIACVRIPRFAVAAAWRAARRGMATPFDEPARRPAGPGRFTPPPADASWDALPIAVADGPRVHSVSRAAAQARVRPGMTVADARAVCSRLVVLEQERAALDGEAVGVAAALLAAAPRVAAGGRADGTWWALIAAEDGAGEREAAAELALAARRWHPRPCVAVADSCVAARVATWATEEGDCADSSAGRAVRVVPPGGCARYLAAAPLALVVEDATLSGALERAGVRTAGELGLLPASEVRRRWGDQALAAWTLAHGRDPGAPFPYPVPRLSAGAELGAAASEEGARYLLRAAADRVASLLAREGRAAAAVGVTLALEPADPGGRRRTVTHQLRPARPLADADAIFRECGRSLARWTGGLPVRGLELAVVATAAAAAPARPLDPALAEAMTWLRRELGRDVRLRLPDESPDRPPPPLDA
ncbi:MAG TPA: hypothetical protein VNA89_10215 [Gemmatimonadaceae bacterium]|nr:hypothetical protein [Gemmatimonadaceae bacterium]